MNLVSTQGDAAALAAIGANLRQQPAGDEASLAAAAGRRARRRRLLVNVARLAVLVVVVGGWQLFTQWKIVDPFFFGQPSGIVLKLKDWVEHGTAYGSIWLQIGITMKEALLGFGYGTVTGIVLGVLLGQVPFLADVIGPYIKVLNAIPRIVLGSIFVVWLGFGTPSKVLLAAVLVFFVVFFNAFQGVREVDPNLVANVRVLGASRFQTVRDVVLPSAVVWIIASLHVAFGFAIIGAIVGEFLGAQQGLGLVISTAQNNFDPDGIFAAMLIIAIVALTAEGLISQLEKRLLSWRPRSSVETAGL
ncbi:MAG TPA: ABC transporter permease [Cellulomonas sp.]|uniref:ABC transporter permease n=1 Tax=Cellulomonas sp. TaxID=40001 RepID=UPI002E34D490|nr:ABC transporter permease [Cellulomonas sp.]HEX5332878.1 ABC transporter permease [Cellulomonas sp.]